MALLSKQTVKKIRTEEQAKRESFGTGDKRPKISAGENILYISKAILKNSKGGDPMIEMEMSENEQKQPLKEFYVIGGTNSEVGLSRVVNFLANAFAYEIPECEKEEDVLKQLLQFQGKPFKAAVKVKEQLFSHKDKDQQPALSIVKNPQLWYVGAINDTSFKVNLAKTTVELSDEDKKNYVKFNQDKPKFTDNGGKKEEEKKEDPLPF